MAENLVKENKPEIPDIVNIDIPKKEEKAISEIPAEKPKRKYKPREKKAPTAAAPKKAEPQKMGVNEFNQLLCGVFSLAAMKAGDHWQITPEEATTVSQPLVNILDKMNITEKVANVSDGAMLVIACATITIPRALITNEMMKAKKQTKTEKIISELEVKQIERKNPELGKSNSNGISEIATNDLQPAAPLYYSSAQ